jgi:hypothetical protein
MSRMSGKWAAFAVAAVLIGGSISEAAVIATSTMVRNPPTTLFTTETALNVPNNWVGYTLGISTDDGTLITGIDATISGQLHQRWVLGEGEDPETGEPIIVTTKTPRIVGTTNGDSHFLAPDDILVGVSLDEDNSGNGSPQADTATRNFGVGSFLKGAWGIPANLQATTNTFAYIVVPRGSEPQLDIAVQVGLPGGGTATFNSASFGFGEPVGIAPLVADLPQFNTTTLGEVVNLQPIDTAPGTAPVGWTIGTPSYVPGFGALPGAPGLGTATFGIDPNTGAFTFNTNGATRGVYTFSGTASNAIGSDPFSITVGVTQVPEPATFALVGLALVGFAGFRRK